MLQRKLDYSLFIGVMLQLNDCEHLDGQPKNDETYVSARPLILLLRSQLAHLLQLHCS